MTKTHTVPGIGEYLRERLMPAAGAIPHRLRAYQRSFSGEPLPARAVRNTVDDHVQWPKGTPGYRSEMETGYRFARSSEQVRGGED